MSDYNIQIVNVIKLACKYVRKWGGSQFSLLRVPFFLRPVVLVCYNVEGNLCVNILRKPCFFNLFLCGLFSVVASERPTPTIIPEYLKHILEPMYPYIMILCYCL